MKAKTFDKKFDDDQLEIINDLDLSTTKRPNQAQKRVSMNFPAWMIESLDKEASRVGVTRQSIIKVGWPNDSKKLLLTKHYSGRTAECDDQLIVGTKDVPTLPCS